MRSLDGNTAVNVAATTLPFTLFGGKYGVDVVATGAGTVKLQKLAADGTTYVSVSTATDFATTAGYATIDLPAGSYRWTIATFTAIYARISRIAGE